MSADVYPHAWSLELVRNASGRAFFYVSRFVARGRVEFVLDSIGREPKCFRRESEALVACREANEAAAFAAVSAQVVASATQGSASIFELVERQAAAARAATGDAK